MKFKNNILVYSFFSLALTACSSGVTDTISSSSSSEEVPSSSSVALSSSSSLNETEFSSSTIESSNLSSSSTDLISGTPKQSHLKTFIFGHSLINHTNQVNITPSNETSVPHWMHYMAQDAGLDYSVDGQWGFLPQHDDVPAISHWKFDSVASNWNSDIETFGEADFNSVLITAGNFIQYKPSTENYDGVASDTSPVASTETIIDWVLGEEPGVTIYIYENWPGMNRYIDSFPATPEEFENYNDYVVGGFHDWWIDYHDALLASRPDVDIRMIPVGPIITKIIRTAPYNEIPIDVLYEDEAPHGRPTIYFIAAMITYMAMYEIPTPDDFEVDEIIDHRVRENYSELRSIIWNELNEYNETGSVARLW